MNKIMTLALREYLATVKTKGFVIGLAVAPIFMCGSLIVMWISESKKDTSDIRIAVVDRSGLFSESIVEEADKRNAEESFDKESGEKVRPRYVIEIIEPNSENPAGQRLVLSDRVRKGQIDAFVEIGARIVHPEGDYENARILYFANNAIMADARNWISRPVNDKLRKIRLADAGIEESQIKDLFNWAYAEPMGLVTVDADSGTISEAERANEAEIFTIPMVVTMLIFGMTMIGAMPLLHSVMEEKGQRISEVLLGSIRPFELMMGKLVGGIGVSLTCSAVYIAAGIFIAVKMDFVRYIPFHIIPWFFVFMLLQILMMGSLLLAMGSACNDAKEAQSLTPFVMIPMIVPMFVLVPMIENPDGSFATGMSLIPLFTPVLMLLRQCTTVGVPWWQPWAGLGGVVLFTAFAVWAGGRIFRVGILMQGMPPKLTNIIRWAIRG